MIDYLQQLLYIGDGFLEETSINPTFTKRNGVIRSEAFPVKLHLESWEAMIKTEKKNMELFSEHFL